MPLLPPRSQDSIIQQIVNSATDGESTHEILFDLLEKNRTAKKRGWWRKKKKVETRYYRFNPTIGLPNDFAIDETDPLLLEKLKSISKEYMEHPERETWLEEIKALG